jgi:Holliday junction resolvasome RuvABC endonuclease subunit
MKVNKKLLVIGIDPATGITSRAGLAAILPHERKLLFTDSYAPELAKDAELAEYVKAMFLSVGAVLKRLHKEYDLAIGIEHFVMQGRAGQMLNQVVGAFIAAAPNKAEVTTIHTMTVKKQVFGSVPKGLTKKQVAEAALEFFDDSKSKEKLERLIEDEAWDTTDAVAIAIATSQKLFGIGVKR